MPEETWSGRWWLPTSPERQVGGRLTLNADDFGLSTDGSIQSSPRADPGSALHDLWRAARHPVVLGTLSTGEDVTLVDCTGLATVAPFSQAREVWRPNAALLGVHLVDPEERIFDLVEIRLEHLPAFAGNPGIGIELEQRRGGPLTRVAFEAERRVLQQATTANGKAELVVGPRVRFGPAEGHLELEVKLVVTTESPLVWTEAWSDWTVPLRDLLSVLSGRPCSVQEVVLRRTAEGDEATARLLRRTNDLRQAPPARPLWTEDFVLNAGDLPGGFEQGLRRWLDAHGRRRLAIREVVDVLHAPFAYVEDVLLANIRALGPLLAEETKAASEIAAQVEHQQFLDEVREALPDHLRDGVIAQLKPSGPNERHRLRSLIDQLEPVGPWLTGGAPDEFAARVIATRGHLVHPSRKPPARLLESQDLVRHTRALVWLVRTALLVEIGMSTADLAVRLRSTEAQSVADAMAEGRSATGA